MKFNFKQISAVLGSLLMVGMTAGIGAAANYPSPFIQNGVGDFAVVYGASAATSDTTQATSVANQLQGMVTTVGLGSDTYQIQLASTKFNLGRGVTEIVSGTITDDNLPTLLADGKYRDVDNDEKDFTQKLILANWTTGMFDDNDYVRDTPTLGVKLASGASVLNYTLDFSDNPTWDDIASTDMTIMGKTYYVLSVGSSNQTMTLLDAAQRKTIAEGETVTLVVGGKTYEVTAGIFGSSTVKLVVNGETTTSLSTGSTYRLSDGSYVGIKDLVIQNYAGGLKQAEFSIGSGRLILTHNTEVQMNDDTISRLKAYITNTSIALDKVDIEWKADGDTFIAPNSEPTMPGFGSVKLVWGGMTYPKDEAIKVEYGGSDYLTLNDFPIKDTTADINFLYGNSTNYTVVGKDSDELLRTVGSNNLTFDADTDSYFVISWASGANAESYLAKAGSFSQPSSVNKTKIYYYKDGSWTEKGSNVQATDTVTFGNAVITIGNVNYNGKTVEIVPGTSVGFNTLYSKEGLKVHLPWTNVSTVNLTTTNWAAATTGGGTCTNSNLTIALGTAQNGTTFPNGQLGYNTTFINNTEGATINCWRFPSTYPLVFYEEDKNGNIGSGNQFNLTMGFNSATTPEVSVTDIVGESVAVAQIGDTKVWESHIYSPLATKILWDKSGDQYIVAATYAGEEAYGNLYVSSIPIESSSTDLGAVLVTDAQVASVSGKNLVVVGGSCINSVAASLLGVSAGTCSDAWTTATSVGTGQFLIQSFDRSGKVAVLVAGYEAGDTVAAASRVMNQPATIDTTVGNKYVYSTGTEGTSILVSGP